MFVQKTTTKTAQIAVLIVMFSKANKQVIKAKSLEATNAMNNGVHLPLRYSNSRGT
jgi:hypothetical protein